MLKGIQFTEIHKFDVDCVINQEILTNIILNYIAEQTNLSLESLKTYCDIQISYNKEENSYSTFVRGEIPFKENKSSRKTLDPNYVELK